MVAAFGAGVAVAVGIALGLNAFDVIDAPKESVSKGTPDVSGVPLARGDGIDVPRGDSIGAVEPGEPCEMAVHAKGVSGLRTNIPVWPPANAIPTDAWTCGDTPVLLYGDVQITYEKGWTEFDHEKRFAAWVRDDGGRIETILGRPAYVHPADAVGPRNSVMVFVDEVMILATAKQNVPIEKLVRLVSSIQLPPERTR